MTGKGNITISKRPIVMWILRTFRWRKCGLWPNRAEVFERFVPVRHGEFLLRFRALTSFGLALLHSHGKFTAHIRQPSMTWTQLFASEDLPSPRFSFGAAVYGAWFFVFGGRTSTGLYPLFHLKDCGCPLHLLYVICSVAHVCCERNEALNYLSFVPKVNRPLKSLVRAISVRAISIFRKLIAIFFISSSISKALPQNGKVWG